jgi:hypothetical protein
MNNNDLIRSFYEAPCGAGMVSSQFVGEREKPLVGLKQHRSDKDGTKPQQDMRERDDHTTLRKKARTGSLPF